MVSLRVTRLTKSQLNNQKKKKKPLRPRARGKGCGNLGVVEGRGDDPRSQVCQLFMMYDSLIDNAKDNI